MSYSVNLDLTSPTLLLPRSSLISRYKEAEKNSRGGKLFGFNRRTGRRDNKARI